MKEIFQSEFRRIFLLGLLFHVICAWFSVGYNYPDEHFQILEFSNYKMGLSPADDLSWEYHEKIRPAIQPAIVYAFTKPLFVAGLKNPFTISFLLRLVSGIAAWMITCLLCLLLLPKMKTEKGKKILVLLSLFLWFVPYQNVRFSSENISALLLLSGVYLVYRNQEKKIKANTDFVLAGLFFGISFFIRFQMAFAMIGFGLWMIVVDKIKMKYLLILFFSAVAGIGINILIDSWFYDEFVITPLNYFQTNIILDKAAKGWDVSPWWYYFIEFIKQAVPPLSLILLFMFVVGICKNLRNPFVWMIIPFVIIHCVVGHKELRFLFPVTFIFIYITSLGFDTYLARNNYLKIHKYIMAIVWTIVIPLFIYVLINPAQIAVRYYQFLYEYASEQPATIIRLKKDVYSLVELKVNFYRHPGITSVTLDSVGQVATYLENNKPASILFLNEKNDFDVQVNGYTREEIYCIIPLWVLKLEFNNWQARTRIWSIYRFTRKV